MFWFNYIETLLFLENIKNSFIGYTVGDDSTPVKVLIGSACRYPLLTQVLTVPFLVHYVSFESGLAFCRQKPIFAGAVVKTVFTGFCRFFPKSGKIFQNPKSFPIIVAFI